jgi:hypothetical protein
MAARCMPVGAGSGSHQSLHGHTVRSGGRRPPAAGLPGRAGKGQEGSLERDALGRTRFRGGPAWTVAGADVAAGRRAWGSAPRRRIPRWPIGRCAPLMGRGFAETHRSEGLRSRGEEDRLGAGAGLPSRRPWRRRSRRRRWPSPRAQIVRPTRAVAPQDDPGVKAVCDGVVGGAAGLPAAGSDVAATSRRRPAARPGGGRERDWKAVAPPPAWTALGQPRSRQPTADRSPGVRATIAPGRGVPTGRDHANPRRMVRQARGGPSLRVGASERLVGSTLTDVPPGSIAGRRT